MYSPEQIEELGTKVAELLAEDHTYEQIAKMEGMPSKSTIIRWLASDEAFETKCARARLIQADSIDDKIGSVIHETYKGDLAPDVARVVLGGMQWRAERKNPKRYGNSTTLKGDKDHPLATNVINVVQTLDGQSSGLPKIE